VARWETGGQELIFENCALLSSPAASVEISARDEAAVLDARRESSLLQAPQQRVQALLDALGGR